ncbi:hypothetical protein Hanom_Chr13g01184521 [Helianthus anomalus]
MASILKGRLALALIMLIVASSTLDTISLVDARTSYKRARQLSSFFTTFYSFLSLHWELNE